MHRLWLLFAACFLLISTAGMAGTMAQAKSSPAMMRVTVDGVVTYIEPGECYIEATDRSGGVFIVGSNDGIAVGDRVTATGTLDVLMGEPAIRDAVISSQGSQLEIRPFGMTNRNLGGQAWLSSMSIWDYIPCKDETQNPPVWDRAWARAIGCNNVGLLVTTCGTVKSICQSSDGSARWLYIDDGSEVIGDFGELGVLVYTDAEVEMGDRVSVTGVSSTEPSLQDSSRLVRVIRTRGAEDMQIHASREKIAFPFSDEFDGPVIDPRWLLYCSQGGATITSGWISLTSPPSYYYTPCTMAQQVQGDWQMDVKLRVQLPKESSGPGCWITIAPKALPFSATTSAELAEAAHFWQSDHWVSYVRLLGGDLLYLLPSDTCYFRIRRQSGAVTCAVSFDGSSYWESSASSSGEESFIAFVFTNKTSRTDAAYLIDYVRFTPLTHEGGLQ